MAQKFPITQFDDMLVEDVERSSQWADSIELLRRCAAAIDAGTMPVSALDDVRDIVDRQLMDQRMERADEGHAAHRLLPMEITYLQ